MTWRVPGTACELVEERDEAGRLRRLTLGGRVYLEGDPDGTRRFDGGVTMSELALGTAMFRKVRAGDRSWTEVYRADEAGRPIEVDGVDVRRDERGRVIACGEWRYTYAGDDLAAIETPRGVRHLTRDGQGRPVRRRDEDGAVALVYDPDGRRVDVAPPPASWNRDDLGRLWTVTGPDGAIEATYLWDGFACLGRVDGQPGAPLAAVFSLDPTCTPVRVIEGDEVTRIPRDAFGEGLLDHPGVPGLFGGAQHHDRVYFAARPLDPATGAWTAPDPWNGLAEDPRRAAGFRGTLLVERGPYTVCLDDPVGRVDPTGEASAGLILSTVTWSWQNNLIGWLSMDFLLNFWVSLFGAIGDSKMWDRFASFSKLSSSDHVGAFGVRRDGIWAKNGGFRAWTYQHMVWAAREHFDELDDVQVFMPGATFEPSHYGSVIAVRPTDKPVIVLVGDASSGGLRPGRTAANWTRGMSGDPDRRSRARPLWDGSLASTFPSGPLHLDSVVAGTRGVIAASAAELFPSGAFGFGTIEPRALLAIERTGLALNPGDTVYFGNGEGVIARVLSVEEDGGRSLVRLEDDATAVTAGARIRTVARQSEEDVPRGASAEQLNVVASSSAATPTPNDYDVGDHLRFSTGTTQLGARRVAGFEARITIDLALPAAITAPLTLRTMTPTPGGNGRLTANPLQIRIAAGAPPVGTAIAVNRGGTIIPVFLEGVDPANAQIFVADRELYTGPSLDGTAVTWQRLSAATDLSTDAALPVGLDLTYQPGEIRRAPGGGFVAIESAGGRTIRTVTARAYDALVLNGSVPGVADPVHVERFTAVGGGVDEPVAEVTQGGALSVQPGQQLFDAAADPRLLVVHLVGIGATALAAGTALTVPAAPAPAPTFAGATMRVVYPALAGRDTNIAPGNPVILAATPGGTFEVNIVRELHLTIGLDRVVPAAGTTLRIASLDTGSFAYDGVRVAGRTVTVLPNVTGTGRVQMPQFWPGEIVRVDYTLPAPAGATSRLLRVKSVDGATLELEEDQPIEATATAITVTRMRPTDPSNGGPWRAIEGAVVTGAPKRMRVKAWRANEFGAGDAIAVVDGTTAHPARVADGQVTVEIVFVAAPAAPAYTLSMPNPTFSTYVSGVRREDDAYLFAATLPAAATANPANLVVAATYAESAALPGVDGEVSPGTVLVPDIESLEVSRRQSLVDHELTHTNQSARWGPMLLCFLPIHLLFIDRLVDLIPGVDAPEFSAYVAGTLRRSGSRYSLAVPDGGGVTFAADNDVEITLGHVVLRVALGAKTDDAFAVVASETSQLSAGLADGASEPVQVRLQRSPGFWGHTGRNLQSALQLSTHGGVLNLTIGSTYGALIGLLARLVYAAGRSIFASTKDFPAQVVEGGAAVRLTSDAGKAAFQTEPRVAIAGSATLVRSVSAREEDGALLRLVGAIPTDPADVRISVYSTRNNDSSFDWHSYYPARVPDEARPAQIRVDKVDGSPSLAVGDEVWLRDAATTWHSRVTAATDEGASILVDLSKPVARSIVSHDFRLAKVEAGSPGFDPDHPTTLFRDPLGFLSDDLMNLVGAGWMRWFFNPWGEGLSRLHNRVPTDSFWWKFLRVFTHIASTSLNTYGWSLMPPAFGWLMWDRELVGKEHQSYTEQEASSASGDLYSPAGRLFGRPGDGMVVGDVARYVYYHLSRKGSLPVNGQQDRITVGISTNPRVGIDAAIATPGRAVPDLLFQRRLNLPYAIGDAGDNTFAPDVAGFIPTGDRLERSAAIHVAFSRPTAGGNHAATMSQGTTGRVEAQESSDYQPAFFNLTIGDVAATVAGQTVTNDAAVRLVEGQRARVSVTPNTARRYHAALLRPANGILLRLDTTGRIVAQAQTGTEAAQIERVYEADELQTHLRRRFVVPVREFDVTVVDAPPLLTALPANADGVFAGLAQNPKPGETVFVVVPCAIDVALAVDAATLAGLTAPAIEGEATPEGLRDFVGDGVIYRVTFNGADTPAAPVPVTFRVTVRGDAPIGLQVTITVDPP